MKLYSVSDRYINYLRQFDNKVYDNKENKRTNSRKYLGIVLKVNNLNYYIPLSSPKKTDFKDNKIRKSIIPIIRIFSNISGNQNIELKGTLRLSNMIPVPESELILYEPTLEKNANYKILIEKELEFINKNIYLIKKYAKIIYNQKTKNYNASYINNVVNFELLEQKCIEYINKKAK